MISFILVPLVIASINYDVVSIGLVHIPVILQPFTVPVGVSGFVATGGDFRGSLLQFCYLPVSALLYDPFLRSGNEFWWHVKRRLANLKQSRENPCQGRLVPILSMAMSARKEA